jgi:hypothetical protein
MRPSAIFMGSPLPIGGKPASQSSAVLLQESAPTRLATLPNHGAVGKEGSAKKHGKTSGLRGEFATLPHHAGPTDWEASFPEMGAGWSNRWQALAHEEQAILAGTWMAHQSVSAGPD